MPKGLLYPFFFSIFAPMFSGIVESTAKVVEIRHDGDNVHFTLTCPFTDELHIDQSVAHNGVCLTVVNIENDRYTVTAMLETLRRTNLGELKLNDRVNIERSMQMNGRLDGHIVQGHVDMTARCTEVIENEGSWEYSFEHAYDAEMARRGYFCVDKGSVTVNGVSLTVCEPTEKTFKVCIIPYTHDHTNFRELTVGSVVNIEFDILGKYIARMQELANVQK